MTWKFSGCATAAVLALFAMSAATHEIHREDDGLETAVGVDVPAACRAMSGSYAVVPLADTAEFSGLVGEYIDPTYVIGHPAYALQIDAEAMTRIGAISKREVGLQLSDRIPSRDLFGDAPIGCALSDATNDSDMQFIHVDLSELPVAQLQGLADYLDHFWNSKTDLDALRSTRDFLVIDQSMIGVANFYLLIPLRKI